VLAECSASLPLHEGLIVTTNGVEIGVAIGEHDTDDVLRVTTVASRSALDAGVSEEVDKTVVIASGEELTVSGAADRVDMGAVSARGVDTGGLPLELASLASPLGALGVAATGRILFAVGDGVEEELVGTAVGADVV